MNQFGKTALEVITSMIAIALQTYLEKQGLNVPLSIVVSVALTVVSIYLVERIFTHLVLRIYPVRLLVDPRSAIEGYWLEEINDLPSRPYALIQISYNPIARDYVLHGRVFDESGNEKEVLKADELTIDPKMDRITYPYRTRKLDAESDTFGFTQVDFQRHGQLAYRSSSGQFMDSGLATGRQSFSQMRLTKEEIKRYVGKRRVETKHDAEILIQNYHAERISERG